MKVLGSLFVLIITGFCISIQLQVSKLNSAIIQFTSSDADKIGNLKAESFRPVELSPELTELAGSAGALGLDGSLPVADAHARPEALPSKQASTQGDASYTSTDVASRPQGSYRKVEIGEFISPTDLSAYGNASSKPRNFGPLKNPDLP